MEGLPSVSKDFLERILNRKVKSFEIKLGSAVGDNYMSAIYSLEVNVYNTNSENSETLYLISKCYPNNPTRQKHLNKTNIFWVELSVYKILLPELGALSTKIGEDDRKLFPPFIAGNAIDFDNSRQLYDPSAEEKIFDPFDIFILMEDIRKSSGFRMLDRRKGLDFDEVKLVVIAQAKLHALSWAYKQMHNLKYIADKFDFVKIRVDTENFEMWVRLLEENVLQAADTVEIVLGQGSTLGGQIRNVKDHVRDIMRYAYAESFPEHKLYDSHRVKPAVGEMDEEPWRVLLHADSWTNNLLFRYNETTSQATEVVIVDLQMMREHCPTLDLVYLMYSSTTPQFRKTHLNSMLKIYHDQFISYCERLGVPTLPNFTLEELTRRTHRAKMSGFLFAVTFLPITLKNSEDMIDVEKIEGTEAADLFVNFKTDGGTNNLFVQRMLETALELQAEGVL